MAASVVIVEEQTGRKRRVELVGGALPLQGANWGGSQLLSTNYNPGNPKATQHVLGPQELPSSWDFQWSTVVNLRNPVAVTDGSTGAVTQIFRAHDVATTLESLFRGGALLKVTWISVPVEDQTGVRIVRYGRSPSWDFNYKRGDDIEGNVEWEWIGRDNELPRVDSRGADLIASLQAAINASNSAYNSIVYTTQREQQARRLASITTPTITLEQLESMLQAPLDLVNDFARKINAIVGRLQQLGDIINSQKEMPAAIAGRVLDVANNGLSVANQFVDTLSRESAETQSTRTKVSVLLQNATYFGKAESQAGYMAEIMERLAEAARQRRSSIVTTSGISRRQDKLRANEMFQTHIPRGDDTMLSISQKYYGTPDLADELCRVNGLPSYTIVPPRQAIIVPTRRNLDVATRNRV